MRTPTPNVIVEEERCVITTRVEKVGQGASNALTTLGPYGQGVKISSWFRLPQPIHYPSLKVEMGDPVEPFEGACEDFFTKKGEE